MMANNKLFIMIKPDGVKRRLVGEIISRFERKGFTLIDMIMECPSKEKIEEHYIEHQGKSFFDRLIKFSISGPVVAMIWEGNIHVARKIVGATVPWEAEKGTIRGDLATNLPDNLVHCSDSLEAAKREIDIWF